MEREATDVDAVRLSDVPALRSDSRRRLVVIVDVSAFGSIRSEEFDGPDAESDAREFASYVHGVKPICVVRIRAVEIRL